MRKLTKKGRILTFGLIAAILWALTGCRTGFFYRQAIRGQLQIISLQRPIENVLNDSDTSPTLRSQLELVLELRDFAENELFLPANSNYLNYADLQRPYVVWNVYAAPSYSLVDKTWWYPFVGSLSYRGYFSEKSADEYAGYLEKKGFDVYTSGVEAYSTLGWFKDPVLNTFIDQDEAYIAETLFHELAHRKLFVDGDTEFNEAFATAVEREGVRRWLTGRGNKPAYQQYQVHLDREREFTKMVLAARSKLEEVYDPFDGERPNPSASQWQLQKQAVIAQLRSEYGEFKSRWDGYEGYDAWIARDLNNAQLNTISTYYRLVPAFQQLLAEQKGDMEQFYRSVKELSRQPEESRKRDLQELKSRVLDFPSSTNQPRAAVMSVEKSR